MHRGGELAVSATVGERGGKSAPAQRSNLSPAHGDKQPTNRDVLVERSGAASGEPAAGSGPTGPATVGKRGGGAASAQRRNLSPARGTGPTTLRGEVAAQRGAFSGELAASGEPAISKNHSLPTHVTGPHQHTPVDYEMLTPVLSPTARNEDEAAEARDRNILRRLETGAEWFAPPSRSAGMWQGRPALCPQGYITSSEHT